MEWYDWLGVGVLAIMCTAIVVHTVVMLVRELKSRRKAYECLDDPIEKTPVTAVGARILAKRHELQHGGSYKAPTHRVVYYMTFLCDDGERIELEVPESVYTRCAEQQTGMLVTTEEQFFTFENGEDI